jgi:cytochrome c-type biogenesis protein CcmH/NrfF
MRYVLPVVIAAITAWAVIFGGMFVAGRLRMARSQKEVELKEREDERIRRMLDD